MFAFVPSTGSCGRVGASAFVSRASCRVRRDLSAHAHVRVASKPVTTTMSLGMHETALLATLPLLPVAEMRVTFPAYLAVFLGTLIPVAFLIILFIQSESRKAGERIGRGE